MRRRPISVLIGLIACGVVLATALGTGSASSTRISKLPAGSQIFGYQLAADGQGAATIVWSDTKDASVTRPRILFADGTGGTDLTLAVNGAGAAVLSWQHQLRLTHHGRAGLPTVHAAEMVSYRAPSGSWLAPHRFTTFAYQEQPLGMEIWGPTQPSSIVTADGTAATAWVAGAGGIGRLSISTRDPTTGNWSASNVPGGSRAADQAVADGPHGSLLTLWSGIHRGTATFLTATSAKGSQWSAASRLSRLHQGFGQFLASDPDGNATVAFSGSRSRILLTTRTGGGWSETTLAGTGFNPEATISTNGSVTVAWEHGVTPNDVIETRTYR